jgi:hypothetical protein
MGPVDCRMGLSNGHAYQASCVTRSRGLQDGELARTQVLFGCGGSNDAVSKWLGMPALPPPNKLAWYCSGEILDGSNLEAGTVTTFQGQSS